LIVDEPFTVNILNVHAFDSFSAAIHY